MRTVTHGLAVAAGRVSNCGGLGAVNRLAHSELDISISAPALLPLADRMLVAVAFGVDQEAGVLPWDPATRQPVAGLFNRHGSVFGDLIRIGLANHAVITLPYSDCAVRIASAPVPTVRFL